MAFWAAAIPAAMSLAGSLFGNKQQAKADKAQQQGFDDQLAFQKEQFGIAQEQSQLPLMARDRATSQLMMELGLGDPGQAEGMGEGGLANLQGFAPQAQGEMNEGQQAILDQSLRGVEQSAAARGGAMGGNALKALQDRNVMFRENMRQNRMSNLASLAGMSGGQFATGQNLSANMGQGMGDTMSTAGSARASGLQGRANTVSSAMESLGSAAAGFFTPNSNSGTGYTGMANTGGATPGFNPDFSNFSLG